MSNDRTMRSLAELTNAGLIPAAGRAGLQVVADRYAVAVSPAMAALIDSSDADDPIARQFVPDARELTTTPEELADPIGDNRHSPVAGIVHRHRDRVLLKLTGICPVYCRFCFRREMIGPEAGRELSAADLDRALAYIAADATIGEVILTGGDPLVLSARRIADVTRRLAAIPHVGVLRWHSRVPVVTPERIGEALVNALRSAPRAAVYVAIHTNHPRELTAAACDAIARLADAGIVLVSQTVLLRGVNDDVETLAELFAKLVRNRVKPYYLHHPDLAPGTSHFRLSIAEGQAIVAALRTSISGLAMPTYVLDIPGGVAKVPVGPGYVEDNGHRVVVRDPTGRPHHYAGRDTQS